MIVDERTQKKAYPSTRLEDLRSLFGGGHRANQVAASKLFGEEGGGGVDFRTARPNVRIRVQLDVRHVFDPSAFNGVRFSAGVVLPLNK